MYSSIGKSFNVVFNKSHLLSDPSGQSGTDQKWTGDTAFINSGSRTMFLVQKKASRSYHLVTCFIYIVRIKVDY